MLILIIAVMDAYNVLWWHWTSIPVLLEFYIPDCVFVPYEVCYYCLPPCVCSGVQVIAAIAASCLIVVVICLVLLSAVCYSVWRKYKDRNAIHVRPRR